MESCTISQHEGAAFLVARVAAYVIALCTLAREEHAARPAQAAAASGMQHSQFCSDHSISLQHSIELAMPSCTLTDGRSDGSIGSGALALKHWRICSAPRYARRTRQCAASAAAPRPPASPAVGTTRRISRWIHAISATNEIQQQTETQFPQQTSIRTAAPPHPHGG